MALIEPVEFISTYNEKESGLLVVAENENQIIGIFNFGAYNDQKRKHRGSLGISLHHKFRGEGIVKK